MSHRQPKTHRPLNTSGSRYGQPLASENLTPPLSGAAGRYRLHCSRGRSVGFRLVFGSRGLSLSSTTDQTVSPYKLPYLSQVADPPASPLRNCQKQESMFLISEHPHHRALGGCCKLEEATLSNTRRRMGFNTSREGLGNIYKLYMHTEECTS